MANKDLRNFIEETDAIGELKNISGAETEEESPEDKQVQLDLPDRRERWLREFGDKSRQFCTRCV